MKQITQRAATVELAIASALQDLGVTKDDVEVQVVENGRKGFLGFGAKEAVVNVTVIEKPAQSVSSETKQVELKPKPPVIEAKEISHSTTEAAPSEVEDAELPGESDQESVAPQPEDGQMHTVAEASKDKAHSELEAIEETKSYIIEMAKDMGITDLVVTCETKGKYMNFQLESEKAAFLIGKRGQTLNAIQQLAQLVANKVTRQFKIVRIDVADYRERREQSLEQLADRMADRAIRTKRQVALEPMPSYERKVIHNALSRRLDVETFSEGKDPYRHIVIKSFE
ncbi:protein jag [Sporosarcina sp. PTS2304]|uniref:RNA-binding cell elongation regulator Jag/EloR n=1 Tax=Sporosarcina sp. PTS2304 TaxID=2283194 RepID=UPI000E0DB239|nr:RNA-binding cell elongation regulator Jag/EloR [Sporosarcina sp. PTS2304]AXI00674.1 protein jag [Sporosarcina sp. PTS2304]